MDRDSLLQLIKSRRSIRKFASDSVPDEVIEAALEAGVWAPSACNQQAVRFIVLKRKVDLAVLNACKLHISNPQAAILVAINAGSEWYQRWYADPHTQQNPILDVGAVVQNMVLVVQALGFASCWVSLSPYLNYQGYRQFFRRFRFPETCRITSAVLIGSPAQTIDVDRYIHHGRPIRRHAVGSYVMEIPSRVLLLGGHPPDFDNLGSQALTAGMKRLIEQEFPTSPRGFLEYTRHDPWPTFPTFTQLTVLPRNQAIRQFLGAVENLVLFGRLLHDERGTPRHRTRFGLLCRALLAHKMKLLKSFKSLLIPQYSPRLNDPLAVGRCPPLPELPMGTISGDDGWIVPSEVPQSQRWVHDLPQRWLIEYCRRVVSFARKRIFCGVSKSYVTRLAMAAWADVVLCDGDGALADDWEWSRRQAIRLLAEWLATKRLGAQTFIVNQSVAAKSPLLKELIPLVYNEMAGIVVREPKSKQELVEMGVASDKIVVGADAAVWAEVAGNEPAEKLWRATGVADGAIGLTVRGDMGEKVDAWIELVKNLHRKYGRPVVFMCSSEAEDMPFARALAHQAPVQVLDGIARYEHMTTILRHLSVLISSRYHPIYFALLAGVPFIALRGNTHKIDGLLSMLEYPLHTINDPGRFALEIDVQLAYVFENQAQLVEGITKQREKLQQLAKLNVEAIETFSEWATWIKAQRRSRFHNRVSGAGKTRTGRVANSER